MAETAILTLTDFLLDRVAEDEAVALAALASHDRPAEEGTAAFVCSEQGMHVGLPPARVLAECEAKREIVEIHGPAIGPAPGTRRTDGRPPVELDYCGTCNEDGYPCFTLRALALPYADHPDYREEEWRP